MCPSITLHDWVITPLRKGIVLPKKEESLKQRPLRAGLLEEIQCQRSIN